MDSSTDYILVLWGKDFDEVEAISFISTLRSAGLRTKVVGLGGVGQTGHLGVAIVPDLMLGQALELLCTTQCIIVPCHPDQWPLLADDPRYRALMSQAAQRGITVVLKKTEERQNSTQWRHPPPPAPPLAIYQSESVTQFASELAARLATREPNPKVTD